MKQVSIRYKRRLTPLSAQSFPGNWCKVPTIVGHYLVQSVPATHGLIVPDIGNGAKPVEVSRLQISETLAQNTNQTRSFYLHRTTTGEVGVLNEQTPTNEPPDRYTHDPLDTRPGQLEHEGTNLRHLFLSPVDVLHSVADGNNASVPISQRSTLSHKGLMFGLSRSTLLGSYFFLISARRA